jgi:signal transduction histidine kinase
MAAVGLVAGALAVLAGLVGALLHAGNAALGRTATPSFWLMSLAAAVAYGSMAVLLRRSPARWLRGTMAAVGLAQGLALVGQEWGWAGGNGWQWALWVGSWAWAPGYVAVLAVLPQLLPDGRVVAPRWRWALGTGVAAAGVVALQWALTPYDLQDFPGSLPPGAFNPVGVAAVASPLVSAVGGALVLAAVVLSASSLALRWRRSAGVERQQLKWVGLGFALTVAVAGVGQLLPVGLTEVFAALAMLPVPVAAAVACLRHGLWGVDTVISRSLLYAALAVAVVAVFEVTSRLLGSLPPLAAAQSTVSAVSALVAAFVALALHRFVRQRVNRLVHGDVDEPHAALARVGRQLEAASGPDDLAEHVVPSVLTQVCRVLRADGARLLLADGSSAEHGTPTGEASLDIPLAYAGRPVGHLALWRRGGFAGGEQLLLEGLAAQASVAVHTVLLSREAQAAREAAALAREAERRRLRHDLHDDVGPTLAALALQAETARELAGSDPQASLAILGRLVPRLTGAVESVRALAHELTPPLLDELGLGAALEELAARLATTRTTVRVDVGALPAMPAALEVAAYRIAGEAVSNAVRHAGATTVCLTAAVRDGALRVSVSDDGTGLPAEESRAVGLGLSSMRLRAEEVGGTLEVTSGAGGTTVVAVVPLVTGTTALSAPRGAPA